MGESWAASGRLTEKAPMTDAGFIYVLMMFVFALIRVSAVLLKVEGLQPFIN